jgi:hypothetical protein
MVDEKRDAEPLYLGFQVTTADKMPSYLFNEALCQWWR